MAERAGRRVRYLDPFDLPDNVVRDIIAGEVRIAARAAPCLGGFAAPRRTRRLLWKGPGRGTWRGPGGWWILDEPELHLGEDIVVPDLAG